MQLRTLGVFFLVLGALFFAVALVSLISADRAAHWQRIAGLAGAGVILVLTGARLRAYALVKARK